MSKSYLIPTEDEEQIKFCDYLNLKNIPFYHPPAEMYTSSWKQKARNKRMGATKGFPDLIIASPKCSRLICIEMKRLKGGVVSEEQKEWIKHLRGCGVFAFVAKGADMAIYILDFLENFQIGEDFEEDLEILDRNFDAEYNFLAEKLKKIKEVF